MELSCGSWAISVATSGGHCALFSSVFLPCALFLLSLLGSMFLHTRWCVLSVGHMGSIACGDGCYPFGCLCTKQAFVLSQHRSGQRISRNTNASHSANAHPQRWNGGLQAGFPHLQWNSRGHITWGIPEQVQKRSRENGRHSSVAGLLGSTHTSLSYYSCRLPTVLREEGTIAATTISFALYGPFLLATYRAYHTWIWTQHYLHNHLRRHVDRFVFFLFFFPFSPSSFAFSHISGLFPSLAPSAVHLGSFSARSIMSSAGYPVTYETEMIFRLCVSQELHARSISYLPGSREPSVTKGSTREVLRHRRVSSGSFSFGDELPSVACT